jgi:hypothetical protein
MPDWIRHSCDSRRASSGVAWIAGQARNDNQSYIVGVICFFSSAQ